MPDVELTSQFVGAMAALDPADSKRVAAFLGKLVREPGTQSLRPEIVHDAADRAVRSYKVTHDLRAIGRVDGDRLALLYVARHDKAYAWARDACSGCREPSAIVGIVHDRPGHGEGPWLCSTVEDLCAVLTSRSIVHDLAS